MGTICSKTHKSSTQQVEDVTRSTDRDTLDKGTRSTEVETKDQQSDDEKEYNVCNVAELQENEMKVCEVGEKQVLVVKENNEVFAFGTKCTHYGAPLSKGIFCKGKVYCPWHGACFSGKTGDIEEFPALDPIPRYPVRIDSTTNEVKISFPKNPLVQGDHAHKALRQRDKTNENVVLIIGSGGSGHSCAETLRQEGFTGRIIVVTKENYLPYDRPKLSKVMSLDGVKLALRSEEYYKKGDIEIIQGVTVEGVDAEGKTVLLSNGNTLSFTFLVIGTGGRPRPLPCPGTHLNNVCLLRSPDDANFIAETAEQRDVVIVGTSFIGMEAAAYLVDKAASVTVVGRSSAPFSHVFGPFIGKRLQEMHAEKGVRFVMETEVAELRGDEDGNLTEVELTSGQILKADLILSGLGVLPCTEFLRDSDVVLDSRGYVPVDEFMRTNCPDIYAVGDIASFPMADLTTGKLHSISVGHWQMALHHGRTAAQAILGCSKPIHQTAVPFFWSAMYGKSVRYCGYSTSLDDIVIHGDVDKLQFAAFYCKNNIVEAVATMNFDPLAVQFAALLGQGRTLSKEDIASDPRSWLANL